MQQKFKEMIVDAVCRRYVNDPAVAEDRLLKETTALIRAVELVETGERKGLLIALVDVPVNLDQALVKIEEVLGGDFSQPCVREN